MRGLLDKQDIFNAVCSCARLTGKAGNPLHTNSFPRIQQIPEKFIFFVCTLCPSSLPFWSRALRHGVGETTVTKLSHTRRTLMSVSLQPMSHLNRHTRTQIICLARETVVTRVPLSLSTSLLCESANELDQLVRTI